MHLRDREIGEALAAQLHENSRAFVVAERAHEALPRLRRRGVFGDLRSFAAA